MLGRDDEYVATLERAHQTYLDEGEPARAVRCAFWLSLTLTLRGEAGRAAGWLGRGQRLLDREDRDCVERGYLLMPLVAQHEIAGDAAAAHEVATAAAEIAERFGDADLLAIAMHSQGNALAAQGQVGEGLALLDEMMVAVVSGELSPIVTGLMYCSVIDGCQQVYALRRAQEWTAALTRWCEEQPDMVAFTGRCLVHRAEIMQHHGAWGDALREARRAGGRADPPMRRVAGMAFYRQAELYRLQGEFARAEAYYRDASRCGTEPQPGLALLRLAQGNADSAAAAIRRIAAETTERLARVRLLPAYVEIMLAVGDAESARNACGELERLASGLQSGMLDALVAHARGAVDLDAGDARAALVSLRRAGEAWQELQAPYEAARVRVLVGLACSALGDRDSAALELEAARDVFSELSAAPDVARIDALSGGAAAAGTHGLTPRELQVLRLVAAGQTNKAIAAALVLSERTVDRHVSNIFSKLGTSSRSAATAYAYRHELV